MRDCEQVASHLKTLSRSGRSQNLRSVQLRDDQRFSSPPVGMGTPQCRSELAQKRKLLSLILKVSDVLDGTLSAP